MRKTASSMKPILGPLSLASDIGAGGRDGLNLLNDIYGRDVDNFEQEESLDDESLKAMIDDDKDLLNLQNISLPPLSICILIIGNHGDVLPFIKLAKLLQECDTGRGGHRVRIATHENHRNVVVLNGVEFYPLAGNPKDFSQFVLERGGNFIGALFNPDILEENKEIIKDIVHSCWPAVTESDPEDALAMPFVADAVIANPAAQAHIHVCEALGIPLHIMSPQPWYYPTKEFPHPLTDFKYDGNPIEIYNNSYSEFEVIQWSAFHQIINSLRTKKMGLRALAKCPLISKVNIPFSAMWSPNFVPKPPDWPKQCRVVGTFSKDEKEQFDFDTGPFAELIKWLDSGHPPVLIGFGPMVIQKTEDLEYTIKQAARRTGQRILVQSGCSRLNVSGEKLCFNIGPCPHDWLLPRVAAVIHHGGADTTAAGLRHGKPTLVCPFFGDQFIWAHKIYRDGFGPHPIPVHSLTPKILASKIDQLLRNDIIVKCENISQKMSLETDGAQGALQHFLQSLPFENMLCDVSVMMGEPELARYTLGRRIDNHSLKVGTEIAALMYYESENMNTFQEIARALNIFSRFGGQGMKRHGFTYYALGVSKDVRQGMVSGMCGCLHRLFRGLLQPFLLSNRFARRYGFLGCILGLLLSPMMIIAYFVHGMIVLWDRPLTGYMNSKKDKNVPHVIDTLYNNRKIYPSSVIDAQMKAKSIDFPEARREELLKVLELVYYARDIFDNAGPTYPNEHLHFTVVNFENLVKSFDKTRSKLELRREEYDNLLIILKQYKKPISFTIFCRMLHLVMKQRIWRIRRKRSVMKRMSQRYFTPTYSSPGHTEDYFEDHKV